MALSSSPSSQTQTLMAKMYLQQMLMTGNLWKQGFAPLQALVGGKILASVELYALLQANKSLSSLNYTN